MQALRSTEEVNGRWNGDFVKGMKMNDNHIDSRWYRRPLGEVTGTSEGSYIDLSNRHLSSDKISEFLSGPLVSSLCSRLRDLSIIHRSKVIHVDLSMNRLDSMCVEHLESFITPLRKEGFVLRSVKLCHNCITDEGCTTITRIMRDQNVALQEIDLSHNLITHVGVITIITALSQMRHLYPFMWRDNVIPLVIKLHHNRISGTQDLMPTLEKSCHCKVTYKITSSSSNSKWGVLRTPVRLRPEEIPMIILHLFMVQVARNPISPLAIVQCYNDAQALLVKKDRENLGSVSYSRSELLKNRLPRMAETISWGSSSEEYIEISMYYTLLQQCSEIHRRFTQYGTAGKKEHRVRELLVSEMKRLPWKKVFVRDSDVNESKQVEQLVSLWAGWKELLDKAYRNDSPPSYNEVFKLVLKLSEEMLLYTSGSKSSRKKNDELCEQLRHRCYESNEPGELWRLLHIAREEKLMDAQLMIENKIRKLSCYNPDFMISGSWNVGSKEFLPLVDGTPEFLHRPPPLLSYRPLSATPLPSLSATCASDRMGVSNNTGGLGLGLGDRLGMLSSNGGSQHGKQASGGGSVSPLNTVCPLSQRGLFSSRETSPHYGDKESTNYGYHHHLRAKGQKLLEALKPKNQMNYDAWESGKLKRDTQSVTSPMEKQASSSHTSDGSHTRKGSECDGDQDAETHEPSSHGLDDASMEEIFYMEESYLRDRIPRPQDVPQPRLNLFPLHTTRTHVPESQASGHKKACHNFLHHERERMSSMNITSRLHEHPISYPPPHATVREKVEQKRIGRKGGGLSISSSHDDVIREEPSVSSYVQSKGLMSDSKMSGGNFIWGDDEGFYYDTLPVFKQEDDDDEDDCEELIREEGSSRLAIFRTLSSLGSRETTATTAAAAASLKNNDDYNKSTRREGSKETEKKQACVVNDTAKKGTPMTTTTKETRDEPPIPTTVDEVGCRKETRNAEETLGGKVERFNRCELGQDEVLAALWQRGDKTSYQNYPVSSRIYQNFTKRPYRTENDRSIDALLL